MKILCLNTVQLLIRDALNNFSNSLCNQPNSIVDSAFINIRPLQIDSQMCNELICSKIKPNERSENQQQNATTSSNVTHSPIDSRTADEERTGQNCGDHTSKMMLRKMMQNLMDAINDQCDKCVKQLPPMVNDKKKKRKRKRKRKKSKLTNNMIEISNERPQSSNDPCSNRQSRLNEVKTRSPDKIYEMDSQSSEQNNLKRSKKYDQYIQKSFSNSNKFKNTMANVSSSMDEPSRSIGVKSDDDLQARQSFSSSSNRTVRNYDSHKSHHYSENSEKFSFKRKRDDNSPNYQKRKRITSARKPATIYQRKDASSTSTSCSDRDENSMSSYSSSSDSSSEED